VITQTAADALADEILGRRAQDLESRVKLSPRNNSWLSDISDCERQMAYAILDWDKRPPHDADLQARFDAGHFVEDQMVVELIRLGFRVTRSQMPVEIKNRDGEVIARGKLDGFIDFGGKSIPIEIKSMNLNVFNSIRSVEDFQRKPWLRRYTRQLTAYMYGNNAESALFLITDGLGRWKVLPLTLDYGEAEAILQRLERVHAAVKVKTYPERIPYDYSICGKCAFAAICLQNVLNRPADFIENEALEDDITRHEELKPLAGEYDELHDKIKETFKGVEKAVVGTRWMVQMVPSQRTTYDLPPEAEAEIALIKQAHAKKVPMTRLVIEELPNQ
jgi:CRISPR/Cas system-associated exonuclease Cas4 (RecB family)